jgi:hypothetical protein
MKVISESLLTVHSVVSVGHLEYYKRNKSQSSHSAQRRQRLCNIKKKSPNYASVNPTITGLKNSSGISGRQTLGETLATIGTYYHMELPMWTVHHLSHVINAEHDA